MVSKIQKIIDRDITPIRDRESLRGFAVSNGINFLAREQEKDGSFFCLTSKKLDDYSKAERFPAIVPTNIVLSSLAHITNDKVTKIKQNAAKFLLGQKGGYWSFNYWFRKSDWYKKEPHPDDTDDTFCALAALYEHDPKLFDGEVMARIVTMLTSAEEKEGGPYDMWLVPPKARDKWIIDLVCNSNIAYFLSLQDIHLPKLDEFIGKSIQEKNYEFPYNKIYPGIYFISRFYPSSSRLGGTTDGQAKAPEEKANRIKEMVNLLLRNQEVDGKWENPLRTALAISSLVNFEGFKHKRQLEKGVDYLIKTQGSDGSWEPYSFYFQLRTKKKTLYAGSPFITTALCLEAIHKYNKISNFPRPFWREERDRQFSISKQITNSKLLKKEETIYNKIIKSYQRRFSGFSKDFQDKAIALADKILTPLEVAVSRARLLTGLKKNKDIVLLPFYFRNALGPEPEQARYGAGAIGRKVGDDLIVQLGAANLFGWIAYTVYDDFLDEEGNPKELSIANVCLRESAEIFGAALPQAPAVDGFADTTGQATGFSVFSKKIFDIIDDANMWEVTRCRAKFPISNFQFSNFSIPNYGDYSQLANKSLGHALGPIAILFALGYKANSPEVKGITRFFRNYIVARQLNDDAHDWEDDLKRGHVNAVVAMLLKDVKGNMSDPRKLREIFWHKIILGVCKDILKHMEFAKKDLKKLPLIKNPEVFERMLVAIECSADKALKEREETMKFLKTYNQASE